MNLISSLKRVMIPLFLATLSGFICGKLVYNIYDDKTDELFTENLIYLVQAGAYSSYDSMRTNTIGYNYVYYEDEGLYKAVIGVTKDKDNLEKIKKAYNQEVVINSYYLYDEDLMKKISSYDEKLKQADQEAEIKEVVIEMLNLYKEKENIKIIKKDL